MSKKIIVTIVGVVFTLVAFATPLSANPKSEYAQTGVLALSGLVPAGGDVNVPAPAGGLKAPILGSVNRKDQRTWVYSVINNSTEKLSVTVEFAQYYDRSTKLESQRRSLHVAPGKESSIEVTANSRARGAALHLVRVK